MESFGKALKQYRKVHGLTQRKLAEKINLTQNTISQYESGARIPSQGTYKYVLDKLEMQVEAPYKPSDYPELLYEQEGKTVKIIGLSRIKPTEWIVVYLEFDSEEKAVRYYGIIETTQERVASQYTKWFTLIFAHYEGIMFIYADGIGQRSQRAIKIYLLARFPGEIARVEFR